MPDRRLDDLRSEVWRVMALGQRLHPNAWQMPSMCDQWTVSDVFAHLAADFVRYAEWLGEALKGNFEPPFEREALAADNAMILERYVGISGPERLEEFEQAANDYLVALELIDTDMPQGNPLGTITVGEQVVWATVECAIHGWDVARAIHIEWAPPESLDRLVEVWLQRRPEPLDDTVDSWSAILMASGREV
ncbi:MAG: maleylpyruvate isomerase family mycothiol-dependent enzyme [Actinomycetota bacterium]|nr:maleylpyruvate isomerase family mycothiol-dependent enzyme [Actinomycetota bacterium]